MAGGQLAAAVKYTARWLVAKPNVPAHGGLLFEVDGDRLSIFGFNENATARATVDLDGSDEPKGAFVIAGRLIDALVATFPDEPIRFEQEGAIVAVAAGRGRWELPAMSEKDYPGLPGQAALAGFVDGAALADAVGRVAIAAGRDPSLGVELCGIHVSFDEDPEYWSETDGPAHTLTLSATNKYQAARQSIRWAPDAEAAPIGEAALVLASVLSEAADAFVGPDDVAIGWESGTFSLTTPWRSLVVSTLDERKFPAAGLGQIFAARPPEQATIAVKDLTLPLKRADLLRKSEKVDTIRLGFTEDLITMNADAGERGSGDEEIDAVYAGPATTLLLSSSYLRDTLHAAPGEQVTLHFTPDAPRPKPVIVTSPAEPAWQHMLQPLRDLGGQ